MNAKEAYKYAKKHTDDKIALAIIKGYLKKNKIIPWFKNKFGIEVNRKFNMNVSTIHNSKFNKDETIFEFTFGFMFKKKFKVRVA